MNGQLCKIGICSVFTLLFSLHIEGQIDTSGARRAVIAEAHKFVQAHLNNDQETFLAYTHPQAVKQSGGAQGLREAFKQYGVKSFPEASFILKSPGQIILEGQTVQCALSYDLSFKWGDTTLTAHHNLIALSAPQNAKKWYFIDALTLSLKSIKSVYSFISRELEYLDTDEGQKLKKEIKWKIPPFIKAKSIEDYDPAYGQVVFRAYLGKSAYTLDGIADVRGKELVPPSYLNVSGNKNKWQYSLGSNQTLIAFKKSPAKTFAPPFKGYDISRDTILFPSGLRMIGVSKDSFKLTRQGKELGYISSEGVPYPNGQKYITLYKNRSEYLMNQSGRILIAPGKFRFIRGFNNGFSAFATLKETDENVLIDTLGNILNELNGLSPATVYPTCFTVNKTGAHPLELGIMDQKGKLLISPQFESIEWIGEQFFAGKKEDQWTVYNLEGKPVLKEKFDWVQTSGDYWVSSNKQQQKMFLFDKNLKLVQSYNSDEMHYYIELFVDEETKEPFVAFTKGLASMLLYNKQGQRLTDEKSNCQGGFIPGGTIYTLGDKMGLVALGHKKNLPPVFSELNYLKSSQTLWGKIDGKWGLLDW